MPLPIHSAGSIASSYTAAGGTTISARPGTAAPGYVTTAG